MPWALLGPSAAVATGIPGGTEPFMASVAGSASVGAGRASGGAATQSTSSIAVGGDRSMSSSSGMSAFLVRCAPTVTPSRFAKDVSEDRFVEIAADVCVAPCFHAAVESRVPCLEYLVQWLVNPGSMGWG